MVSFLSSVTLALAGIVVASPLNVDVGSKGEACYDIKKMVIMSYSYLEAKNLTSGAVDYINTHGVTDSLFVSYFGASQSPSVQEPLRVFSAMNTSVTLHCDSDSPCQPGSASDILGAYNDGTNIYFCPSFYNQDDTGALCFAKTPDSGGNRGGTIIHELARAISQIGDFKDGCANARSLASADAEYARDNADNYSCFAMQVYVDTHCPH